MTILLRVCLQLFIIAADVGLSVIVDRSADVSGWRDPSSGCSRERPIPPHLMLQRRDLGHDLLPLCDLVLGRGLGRRVQLVQVVGDGRDDVGEDDGPPLDDCGVAGRGQICGPDMLELGGSREARNVSQLASSSWGSPLLVPRRIPVKRELI
jgi:hypothetical protein